MVKHLGVLCKETICVGNNIVEGLTIVAIGIIWGNMMHLGNYGSSILPKYVVKNLYVINGNGRIV